MIEENIRLTVGIDFERARVLFTSVSEEGNARVIDMDAQQARAISRLLESCAGQLESQLVKREGEEK